MTQTLCVHSEGAVALLGGLHLALPVTLPSFAFQICASLHISSPIASPNILLPFVLN